MGKEALISEKEVSDFFSEPYINMDNYRKALDIAIPRTGTFVDLILKGAKEALLQLAERQVQDAFD